MLITCGEFSIGMYAYRAILKMMCCIIFGCRPSGIVAKWIVSLFIPSEGIEYKKRQAIITRLVAD